MKKFLFILLLTHTCFPQADLYHKISQMIMVGFSGKTLTDTVILNDLQTRGVGSVILFSGNIESPTQLNQLTTQLHSLSLTPLFIAIDQEGGRIARLRETNGYTATYSAYQIGTIFNDESINRTWASLMAGWLKDAEINLNLAPVADVNINPESPAIGYLDRSFSNIPDTVYNHCNWFIDEFHQKNILNCLKHFPGHGSATTDSHLGFTDITNTWADSELIPYIKLIQNGYDDFIMSGHLFNAEIDSVYPASLSNKTLTGLLRDSLGFDGLIITDGMFMGAISNNYTFDEAVELAINAGNDILLYTTNKLSGKSLVDSVVGIVMNKISEGKITEQRINESYNRIILKKQQLTNVNQNNSEFLPDEFELVNYPNPFNAQTNIVVRIPVDGNLSIKIFNIVGEEVAEIMNDFTSAGTYKFSFNADKLSSGIYFIRMKMQNKIITHKAVLLK
ncbi:MAG: T9SS type A sorting domain-containing protein [Ignavibacterium album]|uniref:glycoside hydrolase family 3 N-terminal domain-containing protein n=1 Tax=Ignavibacterium album TaxID=591197 RepID=UPI0026F359D3|nr:glycoside hydrolase family 3 N-terminal domain-containing protein [Ignavibacterium album]MBI5661652.1 T9SS type A sorting domain-containing protein [Ignavibacterium album]